jgi:septal ring-binding cell division protein DamX
LDPLFTRKRLMVLGVPLLLFTVLGVSAYIWFGMLHKPLPFFAKTSADSAKALAKKDEHSQAHDTTHTAGGHQEKQSHDTVQQEHHDTPHHTPLADNIGTSQVEEHKSDTHTSGSDHASKPETQQTLALEKDESPLKEEHPALVRKQMIAKEELRPSDRKIPAGKTKSLAGKGNNKTVSTKRSGTSLAHATMKHKAPVQKTKTKNEPVRPMATASTNGVFSVQVYASPSSDDAQQWLGKLRQKKIGSGFVSIQDVRGKKWYRVRFGSYPTLQEAQQMASQSGFGTAWVVRLR